MGGRGLSTTEVLLSLVIVALVAFLVFGDVLPRGQVAPRPADRASHDGEALARFAVLQRQAQEYLRAHGDLFTWISGQDLDLRPTPNWTYSLRRVSALEIAVYAHGRTQNQGRRWRLSVRSDGSASTHLEVP